MEPKVTVDRDGPVARIELDRPAVRNCLDIELLERWQAILDNVSTDDRVKLVTVTGAGGNFSAGADLSMFLDAIEDDDRATLQRFIDAIHEVTLSLEQLPVPTLAVVEGYALAGGLEILLSCDLRIATESATIGDQHANYGLVAGGGGTQRLIRQIDTCRANELMYRGRRLSGIEAEDWGLVNRAVPDAELQDAVTAFETELVEKSRSAAALTKDLMHRGQQLDKEAGLDLERRSVVGHYVSNEAVEGFRAFNEGREPEF